MLYGEGGITDNCVWCNVCWYQFFVKLYVHIAVEFVDVSVSRSYSVSRSVLQYLVI